MSLCSRDLLAAARLELARRGDPQWVGVLQRFEQEAGVLPEVEANSPPEMRLEGLLRAMSPGQRRALRRLLHDLGVRAESNGGHGHETECQRSGCMCARCDPLGEQAEEGRRRTAARRLRAGATVH